MKSGTAFKIVRAFARRVRQRFFMPTQWLITSRKPPSSLALRQWLVAAALAVALSGSPTAATPAEAVIDSWLASQTNLQTWSADVLQTRSLKALTQPLVSTGHVWVAIPNHFRWEIGQPVQTIALRRPEALFIIYPLLKRAEKYPLDDKNPGPWRDVLALLEASFPRNRAQLDAHFRVLSVTQTNGLWTAALQPRSAQARRMTQAIKVSFRANDFLLTSTEMTFADGSVMRNDFTNAVLNPSVPPGCFEASFGHEFKVVEPMRK